ncbi:MAG: type II toxin-antitoxin system PemK/MazF family toxin [Candidatus Altiarchaeota archaeon]|nr:type II toxin-antitoxin system PemK/MazF family toxin [Candidatus Altiarchaeota archaeon]
MVVDFPFTDLSETKLRPALVLLEREHDVVVSFISSKASDKTNDAVVLVAEDHPEFKVSGLKTDSVIRLDKIATLSKTLILGEIGEIGSILKKEVSERIRVVLGF